MRQFGGCRGIPQTAIQKIIFINFTYAIKLTEVGNRDITGTLHKSRHDRVVHVVTGAGDVTPDYTCQIFDLYPTLDIEDQGDNLLFSTC